MELENIEYWRSLTNIGLTKIFVLKILSEGANHGYGILKWLESLTHGCCTPMFGTIYPILKNLTLGGLCQGEKGQTPEGRTKEAYLYPHLNGHEAFPNRPGCVEDYHSLH